MRVVTARPRPRGGRIGLRAGVATVATVLAVVALASAAIVFLSPRGGGTTAAASVLGPQPGALSWDGRQRLNVLLMGADGPTPHGRSTNAMVVASYRPGARSLHLLAIPGNLWVTIPGFGQAPISEAYEDGGARLALLTLQSVLHCVIPYYAALGSDAGGQIVDTLGGLIIQVPQAVPGNLTGGAAVPAGRQQMNGATVLRYAGARPTGDGTDRIRRELEVLLAGRTQLFSASNIVRIPSLLGDVDVAIDTNIPFNRVSSLASALNALPASHIMYTALDLANGSVSHYATGNGAVLVGDPARTPQLARELLGGPDIGAGIKVAVLNGTGMPHQATTLATWLAQSGVHVGRIGSAASYRNLHTEVLLAPRATVGTLAAARDVSALIQAPIVRSTSGPHAAVRVVIGRDYVDPTQQ